MSYECTGSRNIAKENVFYLHLHVHSISAIFGLIAVIVFGAKYDDGSFGSVSGSNIHASFYIALFAVVFAIVGAIFFFIGKPRATVKDFD